MSAPHKTIRENGVIVDFDPAAMDLAVSLERVGHKSETDDALAPFAGPFLISSATPSRPCNRANGKSSHRPTGLNRLTLCISSRCSMQCGYCYASGGTYGNHGLGDIDESTCLKAILWAFKVFGSVRHIQFFGGEPTLAPRLLDLASGFAKSVATRLEVAVAPTLGLTTNGLNLTEEVIRIIDRHRLSATVSVDGPANIHNILRPTNEGKPTYAAVAASIVKLRALGIEPEIECTYTPVHQRMGISVLELLDFFDERFGCRVLHCPTVVASPGSPWFIRLPDVVESFSGAIRASAPRLVSGRCVLSTAIRWVRSLAQRRPIGEYCPAGISTLTVAADGGIYPCFMFINRPEARMGDVKELDSSLSSWPAARLTHTHHHQACTHCWMQPLCFGCLADDTLRRGGCAFRSAEPGVSDECDFRRAMAESLLRGFADLYARPWPRSE